MRVSRRRKQRGIIFHEKLGENLKNNNSEITIGVYCSFGRRILPEFEHQILSAFARSVRRVYGRAAQVILLTDEFLDVKNYIAVFDQIRQRQVDREKLLLDRCQAYQEVLSSHHWQTPIIFLDYDILLLKRLDSIFSAEEDVFLTARDYSKSMPINGGVLLFNNKRPDHCAMFYSAVFEIYRRLSADHLKWWGDQLSLSSAVLNNGVLESSNVIRTDSGATVRLIPREVYNFTPYDLDSGKAVPEEIEPVIVDYLTQKVTIAHFKGPRKHLMLSYERMLQGRGQLGRA